MKTDRNNLRAVGKEALLILLLALVVSFSWNRISSKGIPLLGQWDPERGTVTAGGSEDPTEGNVEIDLESARQLFETGEAVFVDARTGEDFEEGHIPGAISLPLNEVDRRLDGFFECVAVYEPIVTYCNGYECDDSHHLAEELKAAGYEDVKVFGGGVPEWESAGYELEKE